MNEYAHNQWAVPKQVRLLWRLWNDEYIVFNPASGHTHLLNLIAGEALKALEQSPGSSTDVMERISGAIGVEPSAELLGHLSKLIAEFDELGLIEPVQQ
jgi:PqqD family protein of HPr-rel-A system